MYAPAAPLFAFLKNVVHTNVKVTELEAYKIKNRKNKNGSVLSIIDALAPLSTVSGILKLTTIKIIAGNITPIVLMYQDNQYIHGFMPINFIPSLIPDSFSATIALAVKITVKIKLNIIIKGNSA
ncbi:hypothetical protein BpHYR1_020381 [Brachionus plicatilis]|uniref:Uncharacterized protein n=1 Tax=Brachionus plicatilis TaxID=10195 RepID=A0A3M7QXJ8_BRAPC|nr:hypothetical protein BpHYR1_020381 [Brachionus plicatilis]